MVILLTSFSFSFFLLLLLLLLLFFFKKISLLQPPPQSQSRYSEPDNRDWRGRSAQFPTSGDAKEFGGRFDSRQQEDNRQDQLNSQFGRAQGVINI
jgi:hypothetical protein